MKKFLVLSFVLLVTSSISAQINQPCSTCLPEGITFTTQAQIDSFQVNYPNCTEIEGDVIIQGSDITNLNGLSVLTYIGGDLSFGLFDVGNPSLTNLAGLENLASIGGGLSIRYNEGLTSLDGLENLASIGESLSITGNYSLTNIAGLEGLSSIGGSISIGGQVGLGGGNEALTSLTGLENIDAGSITSLYVVLNASLSTCDVRSICDYLVAPNGAIEIHDNATGCNNPEEVEEDCADNCLPEGITFTTQSQIDSFQIVHPNCTEIEGDVTIQGSDITNLNGLNVLNAIGGTLDLTDNFDLINLSGLEGLIDIGGDLILYFNYSLTSLTGLTNLTSLSGDLRMSYSQSLVDLSGLEGLTTIGGDLILGRNYSLTSLSGLDNITYIGGNLYLNQNNLLTNLSGLEGLISINGGLTIRGNIYLQNLSGLDNLTSINGHLTIGGYPYTNSFLTSLTGMENIDAGTITGITIYNNPVLSTCHIQSVCDFLSVPTDSVEIHDNATGCDSQEEVEAACGVGIAESVVSSQQSSVSIYPNPTSTQITIELPQTSTPPKNTILTIYNINGQVISQRQITEQQTVVDVSGLSQGVYFVRVVSNDGVMVEKFVKQ